MKNGRKCEPVENSFQAFEVLFLLNKGYCRASNIARELGKNQSTIWRLLERLVKADYVRKEGPIFTINEENYLKGKEKVMERWKSIF